MFKQLLVLVIVSCCLSVNAFAKRGDDPFAKSDVLEIGKGASWKINKSAKRATKSSAEHKGAYYHLKFDNKQIELYASSDAAGNQAKEFSQFEIKDIQIDGEQSSLFRWCLNNQERHKRFLQQGLKVAKNICVINGSAGRFVMRLNKDTLKALHQGSRFEITIKPYRTPLVLDYDISDFKEMYATLNAKPAAVAAAPVVKAPVAARSVSYKKCKATAPAKYKSIKPVEYNCIDVKAKTNAEASIAKQVNSEKEKEKKLAAEKEKQRKLAEEQKQKEMAAQLKKEQLLAAEAAALAASEAKQAQIGGEIAQKMIKVCEKYWSKGEHRCYCQKYIDSAPAEIQASSTCK